MVASVLQAPFTDGTATSATTIARAITTTANGATLHVFVSCHNTTTISSVADGTNTYNLLDVVVDTTNNMRAAHYGAYNVAPNTYTITATYAASVDERIIDVKEIGGVAATPL